MERVGQLALRGVVQRARAIRAIAAARITSVVTWVVNVFDGGDRDLGPGLEEDDRVGLAGDRRADRVRDGDDRAALLAGVAGRGDRVGGLARLGDGDDERLPVERRRAVAELRADGGPGRQAGPFLEGSRTDERGVVGADPQATSSIRVAARSWSSQAGDLLEADPAVAGDAAGDALAERLGLLVDLLAP